MATHIELEIMEFAIRTALENSWLEDKKWGNLVDIEPQEDYVLLLNFENKKWIVDFKGLIFEEDFARALFSSDRDRFGKVTLDNLVGYTRGYRCHLSVLAIKGDIGLRLDWIQSYLEK